MMKIIQIILKEFNNIINLSNNLMINKSVQDKLYKAYIGNGNNGSLIKKLIN